MKKILKKTIRFIAFLAVSPLLLLFLLCSAFFDSNGLVMSFSQFMSLFPGRVGSYLRKSLYGHIMTRCDPDCVIGFGVLFSQVDTEIESGVYVGPQCNIGLCKIEKNCLLGSGVHVISGKRQHDFSDLSKPIQQQGGVYTKILIGQDSWIGNGSIVMANIGRQCVVAAGSVVTDDVPDYSIAAGNPARVVKTRA